MKTVSLTLFLLGILMWTVAFFFGPESELWRLGMYGAISLGAAVLFYLLLFITPGADTSMPKPHHRGPTRKCRICGRPALPDSDLCRYHSEEQGGLTGGSDF